jgi:hypothetical protein
VPALILAVAGMHLAVVDRVADALAPAVRAPTIARIVVTYVREMQPSEPEPQAAAVALAPPAPRRAPRRSVARAPEPAASAVETASAPPPPPAPPTPWPTPTPALEPEVPALAEGPAVTERGEGPSEIPSTSARVEPPAEAASAVAESGSTISAGSSAAASSAAAAPPFEWPESTRIRYSVVGQVRGEVYGQAQVEWIRAGPRYQVHLDIVVGLPVAPLFTRRMSSDGELTPDGLRPLIYDEETKVAFREPRRATLYFEDGSVRLASGERAAAPASVQDSVSQFVQLAYQFALGPERLRPGSLVEVPLALPRHVSTWVYRVAGPETVYTDFGAFEAFHLAPASNAARPGDLAVELWVAPRLRYLPVRLRIQQEPQIWLDLRMQHLPALAAPAEPAVASEPSAAAPR